MGETSVPITHKQLLADMSDGLFTDVGRIQVINQATQFATGHPTEHDCRICNERRGEAVEALEPWTVRFFEFALRSFRIDFRPPGAAFLQDKALFMQQASCLCLISVFWPNELLWMDEPLTSLDKIEAQLAELAANHTRPGCNRPAKAQLPSTWDRLEIDVGNGWTDITHLTRDPNE